MDAQAILNRGIEFAKENLIECCRDLVTWKDTAILPDGKLRELAKIVKELSGETGLGIAEGMVVKLALKEVSETGLRLPEKP